MSGWKKIKLHQFIDVNPSVKLTQGSFYAYIDIDKVSPTNKFVTNKETKMFSGQSSSKFLNGDTVFSRITPCLENRKIAKVKINLPACFGSTEFYVFRAKNGISNADFVYYLTSSDVVVLPAINSMSGASGRQRADRKFIENLKIRVPDLATQQRIVDILSAYEDLIENNNRRIELLEKAAQDLYKEWFVRFRFPGYENAKFKDGLPEGWSVGKLGDYGIVETGKTPPTNDTDNYGNDIMFVKTPDMHSMLYVVKTDEMLSLKGNQAQPKKLLPKHSIMVSCIGTGGIVSINADVAHTNQQINSIKLFDKNYLEWLFFSCKQLKPTIELFGATGATMTNLSKGKFEKLKVLNPQKELILMYNQKTRDIFLKVKSLLIQTQNLKKQRDLLLPRLMSGKLEV